MAQFLTYDNKPKSLVRNGRGPHEAIILGIAGNCIVWEAPSQTGFGNKPLGTGARAVGMTPLSDLEKVVINAGEILPAELQFIASRN